MRNNNKKKRHKRKGKSFPKIPFLEEINKEILSIYRFNMLTVLIKKTEKFKIYLFCIIWNCLGDATFFRNFSIQFSFIQNSNSISDFLIKLIRDSNETITSHIYLMIIFLFNIILLKGIYDEMSYHSAPCDDNTV